MSNTPSFTVADLIAMRDKSESKAFMEFNDAVTHNPDALFAFYEGQDNDYFFPRLQQYSGGRDVEPIKCSNKSRVKQVYQIVITKGEYAKYRKGFFLDKDYDLNQEPFLVDFFVTGSYSIENYYATESCMETTLKQMFNFHTGDPQLAAIMSDYQSMRQQYLDAILDFNSWYCAIRSKYGNAVKEINLDKDMPKGFVRCDFAAKQVVKNYTSADIAANFPSSANYPVTSQELSDAETYIRQDMLNNMRGKYCLSFTEKYLNYLIDLFRTDSAYAAHKRVVTIVYNNIMAMLTNYADTEQGLIDYIVKVDA